MTTSRQKILETEHIANQEALVKRLIPEGPRKVKRVIPGGKTITAQVDKEHMEQAVLTWLRGCPGFTEVRLSWAKDPSAWNVSLKKVHEFDTRQTQPEWEQPHLMRKGLAKLMATLINTRQFVYMDIKKDGIYLAEDQTGKFRAKVTVTSDLQLQPEYADYKVGAKVPSTDWEPFIEFTSPAYGRYTNILRMKE